MKIKTDYSELREAILRVLKVLRVFKKPGNRFIKFYTKNNALCVSANDMFGFKVLVPAEVFEPGSFIITEAGIQNIMEMPLWSNVLFSSDDHLIHVEWIDKIGFKIGHVDIHHVDTDTLRKISRV